MKNLLSIFLVLLFAVTLRAQVGGGLTGGGGGGSGGSSGPPIAHAASHGASGSDVVTISTNQVTGLNAILTSRQAALTAGTGITLVDNVISATGGGGGGVSPYTAGDGIDITADVISAKLSAGTGISLSANSGTITINNTGSGTFLPGSDLDNPGVVNLSSGNLLKWSSALDLAVDLRSYGAIPDDGLDDTAALVAAATAASSQHRPVFVPKGVFEIHQAYLYNLDYFHLIGYPRFSILKNPNDPLTGSTVQSDITGVYIRLWTGDADGSLQYYAPSMPHVGLQTMTVSGWGSPDWATTFQATDNGVSTGPRQWIDTLYHLPASVDGSIDLKWVAWTNLNNTVTIETRTAHGKSVGNSVTISGLDSLLNGTYTIASVPSTTQFTYTKAFPTFTMRTHQRSDMIHLSQCRNIRLSGVDFDGNWSSGYRGSLTNALVLITQQQAAADPLTGPDTFDMDDVRLIQGNGTAFIRGKGESNTYIRMTPLKATIRNVQLFNWGNSSAISFSFPGFAIVENVYGFNGGGYANGGWAPINVGGDVGGSGFIGFLGTSYQNSDYLEYKLAGPYVQYRNVNAEYLWQFGGAGFGAQGTAYSQCRVKYLGYVFQPSNGTITGYLTTDRGFFNGTGMFKTDDGIQRVWGSLSLTDVQMLNTAPNVDKAFQVESTLIDQMGQISAVNCYFDRYPGLLISSGNPGNLDVFAKFVNCTFDTRTWTNAGSKSVGPLTGHSAYGTGPYSPWSAQYVNCSFVGAPPSATALAQINFNLSNRKYVSFENCDFSNLYITGLSDGCVVNFQDCLIHNTEDRTVFDWASKVSPTAAGDSTVTMNNVRRVGPYKAIANVRSTGRSGTRIRDCTLDWTQGAYIGLFDIKGGNFPTIKPPYVLESSTTPRLMITDSEIPITNHIVSLNITSVPADGNTITINGITYTWRTTPVTAASEILIGADAASSAANLAALWYSTNQLPADPYFSRSADFIYLYGWPGQGFTVSSSGSYLSVAHTGQTNVVSYSDLFATADTGLSITDLFNNSFSGGTKYKTNIVLQLLLGRRDTLVHNAAGPIVSMSGANISGPALLTLYNKNGKWLVSGAAGSGSGGVSDGDKGSITVSGSGSVWTLDDGEVTSAKIADGTIADADVSSGAAIAWSKVSKSGAAASDVGAAAASHTHAESDVTGLVTALAGKAASTHTHPATDISDSTAAGRSILTGASLDAIMQLLRGSPRSMFMECWYTSINGSVSSGNSVWGWTAISSGTRGSMTALSGNGPAGTRIISSTTANSGGVWGMNTANFLLGGGEGCAFVTSYTSSGASGSTVFVGYHDSTSNADPVDGCYFKFSDTTLTGVTANNSTRSTTASSYTLTEGTLYRLVVQLNTDASRVDYYVYTCSDGAQVWTDSLTTNIPTGANRQCGNGLTATTSGTTGKDIIALYYSSLWSTKLLAR